MGASVYGGLVKRQQAQAPMTHVGGSFVDDALSAPGMAVDALTNSGEKGLGGQWGLLKAWAWIAGPAAFAAWKWGTLKAALIGAGAGFGVLTLMALLVERIFDSPSSPPDSVNASSSGVQPVQVPSTNPWGQIDPACSDPATQGLINSLLTSRDVTGDVLVQWATYFDQSCPLAALQLSARADAWENESLQRLAGASAPPGGWLFTTT